jgi:hypothetical protein
MDCGLWPCLVHVALYSFLECIVAISQQLANRVTGPRPV